MIKTLFIAILLLLNTCAIAAEAEKETGDFNFDGHADYRVFIMPNGRMTLWDYYLFNPSTKKYEKFEALSDLWNPVFRKADKSIITFSPGGHASLIFTSDRYNWKDGNLDLVESVTQDWDRKTGLYVNIVLRKINDEMRVSNILLLEGDEARTRSDAYLQR